MTGYYDRPSELYFIPSAEVRGKDLMGERFDYDAMVPPAPLSYDGRFIVTCLRCPRSTKRLYVIVYDLHSWPMRVIQHRGCFKDEVIYARPATGLEMAEQAGATRHLCYGSDTWEEIVRDEARYGVDANLARLIYTGRAYDPASDEDTRKRAERSARDRKREEQAFPLLAAGGLIELVYQKSNKPGALADAAAAPDS